MVMTLLRLPLYLQGSTPEMNPCDPHHQPGCPQRSFTNVIGLPYVSNFSTGAYDANDAYVTGNSSLFKGNSRARDTFSVS